METNMETNMETISSTIHALALSIDADEPEVARERAFAMVARLMASVSDLDSVVVDRTERTLAVAC